MTDGRKLRKICLFLMLISVCAMLAGCRKENKPTDETFVVKIGVLLDFTGDKTAESERMYEACELAVDEINEAGGVLTEKLEVVLIKKDDGGDYMNSVAGYYQLVEVGVCAVIGTNNSKGVEELIKASSNSNVPVITPSVTDDFVVDASNFVYQSCISDKYMTEALVNFADDELEFSKAAILYSVQDEREISLYEDFAAAALKQRLELAYAKELADYDTDSVKEAVTAVMNAGAKIIFVAGDLEALDTVMNEAHSRGYDGVFLVREGCVDGLATTYGYEVYAPVEDVRPAYDAVYFIRDAIEEGYLATPTSIALKLPFLEGSTVYGEYTIGAYGNVDKSVDIWLVTDDQKSHAGTVFE